MTHTLHREGDIDNLKGDYVLIFYPARGVNFEGCEEKMKQIWETISHYEDKLANFGNMDNGNSHKTTIEVLKKSNKNRVVHAVFKDRETLKSCLKEIKARDFGMSVVISGFYEEVKKICEEVGLSPHTVNQSLGIHGRRERLPNKYILAINTMCGHMMVSQNLVKEMVKEIKEKKISYELASKNLSRMCECGIFNPYRTEKLLRKMVEEK
jgi:hypothetical protein